MWIKCISGVFTAASANVISSPPDHNFAVGYLVQVGLFYVVNDYLDVPKVSVDFMQPENVMVSQAVQCVCTPLKYVRL